MAVPSSSSSSFAYDVFLSFRGTDTRYGFTGNLYKALSDAGIRTFIDDEDLQRGEEITPSLLKAIQDSRIAIIVLSANYASSSFCLNELSNIIDRVNNIEGRKVFPIFYKVDPSDVRHQRGSYGEALVNHEKKFNANKERFEDNRERLAKWRTALERVANLSGYHFKHGDEYEHKFIESVVKEVSKNIKRVPFPVADYPVGLESQVEEVKLLMDAESKDEVHMVGIHGIGGVGKTTLALAVYNSVAEYFEGLCFLQNVRENSNTHGLQHLQEILLREMFGEEKIKLASIPKGSLEIQRRLRENKVLLILDDVDELEQLQALGRPDWFGPGSRVIITTRDKQLLACHEVKKTYAVKELNEKDALELLRWKAFKTLEVDQKYNNVLNRALTYASGLPLALEVIGSNLFGKSIDKWESALNLYQRIPPRDIQKKLKVSYDALEEEEKSVFLDIACCFKGHSLAQVRDILHAHYGECMKYHIGVLVEKSLIKIIDWYSKVTLHDLIEDMGKEIVRRESPKNPGKRSRLWFHGDIIHVLEEDMGTMKIEIIYLDFPVYDEEEVIVKWSGKAFAKMKNLKTLIIKQGCFSRGPKHLPNSLRILEWWRYPSPCLPSDFHPKQLAICKIMDSCFTSPELAGLVKASKFENTSVLNFDDCEFLTEIPDVSGLLKLKELSFKRCENLTTIDDSVGKLDKLRILACEGCIKLGALPPFKLTSLEELYLNECSSLESFPEILGEMKNIKHLDLFRTPIKELPSSFENLTGLRELVAVACGIVQFPSSIVKMRELVLIRGEGWNLGSLPEVGSMVSSNLELLKLVKCNVSDEILAIGLTWFANVKNLDLSFNCFTIIPECIKECHLLRSLTLDYCRNLREIRRIPPNLKYFSARNCYSLTSESISKLLDQKLHEAGKSRFCLSGTEGIPEWLEHCSSWGRPISFWFRNKFPAIALCIVVDSWRDAPTVIINGKKGLKTGWPFELRQYHTYLFGMQPKDIKLDEVPLKNEWNHVKVRCGPIRKNDKGQIGIHVFKEKNSMDDIQFTNPDPSSHWNSDSNSERGGEFDIGEPSFLHQQRERESDSDHEQSLVDVDEANILSDSEDVKEEDSEEQKRKKRRKLEKEAMDIEISEHD